MTTTADRPAYGICQAEISHGSRWIDPTPPEHCWADTAPWADYCPDHGGPLLDEPDPYDAEEDEGLSVASRLAALLVFIAAVFGPSSLAYALFGASGLS